MLKIFTATNITVCVLILRGYNIRTALLNQFLYHCSRMVKTWITDAVSYSFMIFLCVSFIVNSSAMKHLCKYKFYIQSAFKGNTIQCI